MTKPYDGIFQGIADEVEARKAAAAVQVPVAQLPPLTDAMYHAVRGMEFEFGNGPHSVTGYVDDDMMDTIWEAINTALRVSPSAAARFCELASAPPPPAEPVAREGWQMVPVEPTKVMLDAAMNIGTPYGESGRRDIWSAMLASAPPPPEGAPVAQPDPSDKAVAEAVQAYEAKTGRPAPEWVARKAAMDFYDDDGPLWSPNGGPTYRDEFLAWARDHMGQGYSLAISEGSFIDSTTSYAYSGYLAGRAAGAPVAQALREAATKVVAWAATVHPDNLRKLDAVEFVEAARAALSHQPVGSCSVCGGRGSVGFPGEPCPFCKMHAIGLRYAALHQPVGSVTPADADALGAPFGPGSTPSGQSPSVSVLRTPIPRAEPLNSSDASDL